MSIIMIKLTLASAIAVVMTTSVYADINLYGRISMVALCDDSTIKQDCNVANSGSRLGIKASRVLAGGYKAIGRYEVGFNPEDNSKLTSRLGFVGLQGGFGEVTIGTRNTPFFDYTLSPVDVPNKFGGASAAYGFHSSDRISNTVSYSNKLGAVSARFQIQLDNGEDDNVVDMTSLGASIPVGSVTLGLGYIDFKQGNSITAVHARRAFNAFGIGGTYSVGDTKKSMLLALNYDFGRGKSVNLTFGKDDIDGQNAKPSSIGFEYLHNMGRGFRWYAGYETNNDDGYIITTTDSETAELGKNNDKYGIGMRYNF